MICECCGNEFAATREGQRFCSKKCADKAGKRKRPPVSDAAMLEREFELEQAARRQARLAIKKRLRERDAEYERNFPDTVRGGLRGRAWGTVRRNNRIVE